MARRCSRSFFIALPLLLSFCFTPAARADFFTNVPVAERTDMQMVYQLYSPGLTPTWSGSNPVSYSTNNAALITPGSYSRIGYYVEVLSGPQTGQWVYVEFDSTGATGTGPALTTASTIGLPHSTNNAITRQQLVTNANIFSNLGSITTGTGIGTVNVEMWPSNYAGTAGVIVPGGGNNFDFDDTNFTALAGHGSFQVHNYGAGQTLFALNRWGGGNTTGNIQFGIGNAPAANTDWTNTGNAALEGAAGRIQIFVSGASDKILTSGGNWTSSNWTGGTEPSAGNFAYVGGGFIATINSPGEVANNLAVGHNQATNPGSGTLNITGGGLAVTGSIFLGEGGGGTNGAINLTGGTLSFGGNIISGGVDSINGGTFAITGTRTVDVNNSLAISSNITGTGGLMKTGPGTLTLTGTDSYTGITTVNGGTMNVATGGSITSTTGLRVGHGSGASGALNVTGGSITSTGDFLIGYNRGIGAVNVSSGTLNVGSTGGIVFIGGGDNGGAQGFGTGTLTVSGTGTVIIGGPGAFPADRVYLGGFGGSGTINLNSGGTLQTSRDIQLGSGGPAIVNFNGGTLRAGANNLQLASSLSSANILAGGATFDTNGFTYTVNEPLLNGGGGGGVTKTGAGTLVLAGANTYTGSTAINQGTLRLSQGGNPGTVLSGTINVNTGGTLAFGSFNQLGGATSTTTAPVVVNTGGVVDSSATVNSFNNLTLAGGNMSSTGGFNSQWGSFVLFGTLNVTDNSSILNTSGSNNALTPGAFNGNQTLTINVAPSVTLTNNLPIQDYDATHVYSITKTGDGTAIFTAGSNFTGAVNINGGTLSVSDVANGGSTSHLGAGSSAIGISNGATLLFTGATDSTNRDLTLGAGGGIVNVQTLGTNLTLSGTVTGTSLTKSGAGTLILSDSNTYGGSTTINGGTLRVANGSNLPDGTAVSLANVAGAALDINNQTETIGSLAGGGTTGGNVTLGSGTLTTGGNGGNTVYSGVISGSGNLIKTGGGEMRIDGLNSYTGTTTVNGGGILDQFGGTLQNSSVSVTGAGSQFEHTGGTNHVNGSGGVTIGAGANYTLNGGTLDFHDHTGAPQTPVDSSLLAISGTFTFSNGTLMDVTTIDPDAANAGSGGTFTQAGGLFVVGRNGAQDGGNTATTTILGAYTQNDGATLALDVVGQLANDIDMLIVDGNVSMDGTLAVNPNGVNVIPFEWYNAVKTEPGFGIDLTGGTFNVNGFSFFRVIDDPSGQFGQILQVAVPEPAGVLLWGLLAAGLAWYARRRRKMNR